MSGRMLLMVAGLIALIAFAGCEAPGVSVSAGGGQVAVTRGGSLWVADIDQENWRQIPVKGKVDSAAAWSPDDKRVLFVMWPEVDPGAAIPDSEKARRAILYDTASGESTDLGPDTGGPFAWSPNGQRFISVRNSNQAESLDWHAVDGESDSPDDPRRCRAVDSGVVA